MPLSFLTSASGRRGRGRVTGPMPDTPSILSAAGGRGGAGTTGTRIVPARVAVAVLMFCSLAQRCAWLARRLFESAADNTNAH